MLRVLPLWLVPLRLIRRTPIIPVHQLIYHVASSPYFLLLDRSFLTLWCLPLGGVVMDSALSQRVRTYRLHTQNTRPPVPTGTSFLRHVCVIPQPPFGSTPRSLPFTRPRVVSVIPRLTALVTCIDSWHRLLRFRPALVSGTCISYVTTGPIAAVLFVALVNCGPPSPFHVILAISSSPNLGLW